MVGSSPASSTARSSCSTAPLVVAALIVHPAEAVDVDALVRLQLEGAPDEPLGLVEMHAHVGERVAEVVERRRVARVQLDGLAHLGERAVLLIRLVVRRAEREAVAVVVGRLRRRAARGAGWRARSPSPVDRATRGTRPARSCRDVGASRPRGPGSPRRDRPSGGDRRAAPERRRSTRTPAESPRSLAARACDCPSSACTEAR